MNWTEARGEGGRVLFWVGSGCARQVAWLYGHTERISASLVGPSVITIICKGTGMKSFEKGICSGIWWF